MGQNCSVCKESFDAASEAPRQPLIREHLVPLAEQLTALQLTRCARCRRQHRQAFRNERTLYRRRCDHSGRDIISVYSPNKPVKVYSHSDWWGGTWDPLSYGKAFDFSRPFFEQFHELMQQVPRKAVTILQSENCEYNNNLTESRDCYLVFGSTECEGVYYSSGSIRVRDSLEVWWSRDIELCASILSSQNMYDSLYCQNCGHSQNLIFCRDMMNSSHCFGCCNLDRAAFHIFNIPYSKEEYFAHIERFQRGSFQQLKRLSAQVLEFFASQPRPAMYQDFAEECVGDLIYRSKHCTDCYAVTDAEQCRFCFECGRISEGRDSDYSYDGSSLYQCLSSQGLNSCAFTIESHHSANSAYLFECFHTNDSFGCVGTRNVEYCILNRRYSRSEYQQLMPRIFRHMVETGEWGAFFPLSISPFGYNETEAAQRFPLTKPEVQKLAGWWEEYERPQPKGVVVKAAELPDRIDQVSDTVTQQLIQCEESGRCFRISKAELELYRRFNLPLPRRHPDVRQLDMLHWNPPGALSTRNCSRCKKHVLTSVPPQRSAIVYCADCYQAARGVGIEVA